MLRYVTLRYDKHGWNLTSYPSRSPFRLRGVTIILFCVQHDRRHQTVQETVEIEEKKLDSSDAYNLKKMFFFLTQCSGSANSEQLKVKTVHFMAKPKADFSTELPESFWSVCAPKTIMY